MGMIETILPKALPTIAKMIGRTPQELKGAYQEAIKMLPPKEQVTSFSQGQEILKNIGIKGNFVKEMAGQYGGIGSIFGYGKDKIDKFANQLTDNNINNNSNNNAKQSYSAFDPNKYPKI